MLSVLDGLRMRKANADALPPEMLKPHRELYEKICVAIKELEARQMTVAEILILAQLFEREGPTKFVLDLAGDIVTDITQQREISLRELTDAEQITFKQACPEWQEEGSIK